MVRFLEKSHGRHTEKNNYSINDSSPALGLAKIFIISFLLVFLLQNVYPTTFLEIFSNYWIWFKFYLKNYADLGWCYLLFCLALTKQHNRASRASCLPSLFWLLFCISVYQKSVNSNFHVFWLAPITRNILDVSFRDIFGRWNFSNKWSSHTNKYQKSDEFWLVGCSMVGRKLFSCWICNKIVKCTWQNPWNVCKL